MDREWARKKIEKARVGVEIFLPLAHILPMKIDLLYSSRVGIEKLSQNVEWAAKYFVSVLSGLRNFFPKNAVFLCPPS